MVTVRASNEGLLKIKCAIKRICERDRRGIQALIWESEAEDTLERLYPEIYNRNSARTGVSIQTWNRFRRGERVYDFAFDVFCELLELDSNEIKEIAEFTPSPNSFGYISACGLNKPPEKRNIFNDYCYRRAIDELWADPLAEKSGEKAAYIKAKIVANSHENFLKINFVRQGCGVNVTIRPHNDTPIDSSDYQYMKFKIRSPQEKTVGVRLRIVDADYVHWGYGEESYYEHEGLSTSSNFWKDVVIPLKIKKWFHFRYDGFFPREQIEPNFKAIQLISFDVGIDNNPLAQVDLNTLEKNIEEAEIDISPIVFE